MPAKKGSRAAATAKYANAQNQESEARRSVPGDIHEDVKAALEAKGVQVEALRELDRASEGEAEETVTLVGPNPEANVTDANGLVFRDGKAEGVPKSLADRYVADFDGYEVQGGKGK